MHPRRTRFVSVLALAAATLVAAAGGSGSAASAVPAPVTIVIRDYSYTPRLVTVKVGRRVRFVNRGKIAHTVADTDRKGNVVARLIKPRELVHGASQTVVFKKPGLVRYLCTFHPSLMRGRIRVVR